MPNFLLEKWYMDVVADDGAAAIGYFALVKWKKFSLHYNGFIQRQSDGTVIMHNSFKREPTPQQSPTGLTWKTKFLNGEWTAIDSPIQNDLLKTEDQFIEWNGLMPKGNGKVKFDNINFSGLGYAEKMTLNILPWQVPLKELYWGRFLSEDFTIIWIQWQGPKPKFLIWLNGEELRAGTISNEGVATESFNLSFEKKFELRSGIIGETVFKNIRQMLSIFPTTIFQLNENKWCGLANLTINNSISKGTYIHEHVIWQ